MDVKRQRYMWAGFGILCVTLVFTVFSSPMPRTTGYLEMMIGAGLVFGISMMWATRLSTLPTSRVEWLICCCFVYLLIVPLVPSVLYGNTLSNVVRDVVPLLFLTAIPIALLLTFNENFADTFIRVLFIAISVVGVVSASQFLVGVSEYWGNPGKLTAGMSQAFSSMQMTDSVPELGSAVVSPEMEMINEAKRDFFLKSYDPAVLFAAIGLVGVGIHWLFEEGKRLFGLVAIGFGYICIYALAALALRAYFALIFASVGILFVHLASVKFNKWIVGGLVLISVVIGYFALNESISAMLAKQYAVGANGKIDEFVAALNAIQGSSWKILFGIGWGGTYWSPIMSEPTRFTHSMISFILLKAGVFGLLILCLLFIAIATSFRVKELWGSTERLAMVLASASPILIGVLLQPTYKMLSYGFVVAFAFLIMRQLGIKKCVCQRLAVN